MAKRTVLYGGFVETVCEKGYAKINLTLDVVGKQKTGYHDVRMIMQQIDLCDDVCLKKKSSGVTVKTDSEIVPLGAANIAWQAASLFFKKTEIMGGVDIFIKKRIPVAAGLAGGSADAAAVLRGLNRLYESKLSTEELLKMGKKIGADVPFCVLGGTALAEGIGEKLTQLPDAPKLWLALAKPSFGVSTKSVYENLNWEKIELHPETESMIQWIEQKDFERLSLGLCNVLEPITLAMHPEVSDLKVKMKNQGACGVLMSGSGPSVFGVFRTRERAKKAVTALNGLCEQVILAKTQGRD